MSVTTSAPPPLLFNDRSPSPPAFSASPPHPLPHDIQQGTYTPVASPPLHFHDVDMSASNTMPLADGQNHDRQEDASMHDSDALVNGHTSIASPGAQTTDPPRPNVAVEELPAEADEDAMDTDQDTGQDPVVRNGAATDNGVVHDGEAAPPILEAQTQIEPASTVDSPPPPAQSNIQPPPPPPPPEPPRSEPDTSDDEDGQQSWRPLPEDTSLPDEDEMKEIDAATEVSALDSEHWERKTFTPFEDSEYTAGPSGRIQWTVEHYNGTRDQPNKDLIMKSDPVNIGGHEWQLKFYPRGNDTDYLSIYVECLTVLDKENAKDDSDKDESNGEQGRHPSASASTETTSAAASQEVQTLASSSSPERETLSTCNESEYQHCPLPLLDTEKIPKRKSVAAQVSIVLYNPAEPRVNYSRTCTHRFCTSSPDWGWTRFHGPYYDIYQRMRGQRQALLRNDKLAFIAYIRIVEDDTDCLGEHPSDKNVWDSFAMTGLQSLSLGDSSPAPPGGNLISTIASWLLFPPFRKFLYEFHVPDPDTELFLEPKPLIVALQKVLYRLRTQVKPNIGPVTLDDVLDALEWYGIQDRLEILDVIEMWEVLRLKLEAELRGTPHEALLDEMFGLKKDHTLGLPSYRAPVVGSDSMQEAVNKASNLTQSCSPLPQLLTIELERQEFDTSSRSYVKLINKVTLDEQITVRDIGYTLYGFVVHKQTLQSCLYHPVLRPEGPGTRWYTYNDGQLRDREHRWKKNAVQCLTKREAIEAHEGQPGSGKITGNDSVAYIVMYVRNDVANCIFPPHARSEDWDVPKWLPKMMQIDATPKDPAAVDHEDSHKPEKGLAAHEKASLGETHEYQVISSTVFSMHDGPGIFDAYNSSWKTEQAHISGSVQLTQADGGDAIREKLAAVFNDVQDPRQIKFWFMDPMRGTFARPNLLGTGETEFSSGAFDRVTQSDKQWSLADRSSLWRCCGIWVHIIDHADLPTSPVETLTTNQPAPAAQALQENEVAASNPDTELVMNDGSTHEEHFSGASRSSHGESTVDPSHSFTPPASDDRPEDTVMSDAEEMESAQAETGSLQAQPLPVQPQAGQNAQSPRLQVYDTAMDEAVGEDVSASTVSSEVPLADAATRATAAHTDVDMSENQDNVIPPPPPIVAESRTNEFAINEETAGPTEDSTSDPQPPPDEVYFFLKIFRPQEQTLVSHGSHIALKSAKLDATLHKILGTAEGSDMDLFEEEDLTSVRALRSRRSFSTNDLHSTAIIIVANSCSDSEREALAARAAYTDVQSFLAFRALSRNFPSQMNGHFIHDWFSSQYYKGEIHNGQLHGHGYRIYHSGATYEGSFQLGQRHGHGLYTFQNGDSYDGDWVANQQHGNGTFVEAASGNTYVGGWKNDKKFGEGVTHWKNAQETERLCRICWDDPADAAFYECGHVVACLGCARQVQNCPVCRQTVLKAMKLYYVA